MLYRIDSRRRAILRPANPSLEYQVCRGVADDYDHGNHQRARASLRPDGRSLEERMGLSALALPDTDAPIIDELALASDANPITRTQDDAALVDRDRLRTLDEVMGIEGACSNAYFDALCACVPADVTFNRRSRRPPRDLPNAAPSDGYAILLSEYVSALHAAGLEPSIGIAPRPPTSATAWRWTSWNSSAHSWSTKPSWHYCARASAGPNTASSRPRPGECGWAATARKSSSTRTRLPASDPSPAPSPDTRDRGADTSPTPRRCWCAQSTNPTTSGAGSPGDDLHHRLRHHRQQTADVRRQNTGIWGYRIQESVFQLRIDTATLARVRSSLAVLISESDDVIHIYLICSSCADRADILGAAIALDHVGSRRGMW